MSLVEKYRQKPIEVQAIRVTFEDLKEIRVWAIENLGYAITTEQLRRQFPVGGWMWFHEGEVYYESNEGFQGRFEPTWVDADKNQESLFDFDNNLVVWRGEPFGGWPVYDH